MEIIIKLTHLKIAMLKDCDDEDMNDSKGCRPDCQGALPGWDCSNLWPDNTTTLCFEICGDGLIVGKETCDDMNKTYENTSKNVNTTDWGCHTIDDETKC